jgi:hypothetical protein
VQARVDITPLLAMHPRARVSLALRHVTPKVLEGLAAAAEGMTGYFDEGPQGVSGSGSDDPDDDNSRGIDVPAASSGSAALPGHMQQLSLLSRSAPSGSRFHWPAGQSRNGGSGSSSNGSSGGSARYPMKSGDNGSLWHSNGGSSSPSWQWSLGGAASNNNGATYGSTITGTAGSIGWSGTGAASTAAAAVPGSAPGGTHWAWGQRLPSCHSFGLGHLVALTLERCPDLSDSHLSDLMARLPRLYLLHLIACRSISAGGRVQNNLTLGPMDCGE